jgi:hypothetical protein
MLVSFTINYGILTMHFGILTINYGILTVNFGIFDDMSPSDRSTICLCSKTYVCLYNVYTEDIIIRLVKNVTIE